MTKISALSDIGTSVASNDTFVLVDVSDPTTPNKKIQQQNLFLIPDGSAGTPAVRFLNDTDVGLFRPTTNTLALATGGSERLRIDSSGRVGIGTSAPRVPLEVNTTTQFDSSLGRDTNALNLVLISGGTEGNGEYSTGVTFSKINSDRPGAAIASVQTSADPDQLGLAFFTHGAASTSDVIAERLRINHAGNVGIGTTSPLDPLHVLGPDGSSGSPSLSSNNIALFQNDGDTTDGAIITIVAGTAATAQISLGDVDDGNIGAIKYNNSSNSMEFATNNSNAVAIDSSGRLLVGTSSALDVGTVGAANVVAQGASAGPAAFAAIRTDTSAGPASFTFGKSRSNAIVVTGDIVGRIEAAAHDGTDARTPLGSIEFTVDGTPGANDMPGRLVFSTTADGASSPTERMRIGQNGATNLFLAETGFAVRTAQSNTSGVAIRVANAATNISDGTNVFFVRADGDVENTNNSYAGISDVRLKENIVDAGSQWDDLKALQVRNYNFKAETGYNTHTQIGLVAQEVELVSPGLVGESINEETGESTKSVNYSVLYMKAVKALQEAMERIETLEAKVAALESA